MGFILRPLKTQEEKYTYRQSMQISMQTGLIGYLRADMDTNGKCFFSSWYDFRKELKTEDFKKEFDEMVNTYRKDGEFLSDRETLTEFCRSLNCFKNDDRSFGVRVDSENYAYLCRLNPHKGEYNLYCYPYIRERLDRQLIAAETGIRFVTSDGRELFKIKDGESICITYPNGGTENKICRYIDESHFEIGNTIYHRFEFAERTELENIKISEL